MAIGCVIKCDHRRPDPELIEKFQGIPVANIDDNMGRIGAINNEIVPVGKGYLLGSAFTVKVPQGDNLMFHAAMDLAKPGDVIVIDAGGFTDRAIFGELMATYCRQRGIRGIVCDGAIRDSEALAEMKDFPVYAKAATPNGPYKNGPGEIGTPVVIGGKVIHPGDIIVGDADGVVVIAEKDAEELLVAAEKVQEKEDKIMKNILEKCSYERPWVAEKLKEIGAEIIE